MNIKFNEATGEFEEVAENADNTIDNASAGTTKLEIKFSEKAPIRTYCEETGLFEYEDKQLRDKVRQRKKQQHNNDALEQRLSGLKKHLRRADLEEHIGKTGNSSIGEVSEQNKNVAKIQTQHAKDYILRSRRQR
ncbi:MAG: hypothetical protein MR350_03095 [Alphaproteobacteria bacterium]|nr:hypothetical protein [Alphaproteobacteria bacterium]